jgi:uncharacterized protein
MKDSWDADLLPGRDAPRSRLRDVLLTVSPRVLPVVGIRGAGKSALVSEVCRRAELPTVHMVAPPEGEAALREGLSEEARAVLGDLPMVERPELLPTGDPGVAWVRLLDSIFEALRRRGGGVLVLDGVEAFGRARKRLPGEVAESWRRVVGWDVPLHLVLVARSREGLEGWPPTGPEETEDVEVLELQGLPYRIAGWLHRPVSAREAFRFWALFGDHPGHLAGVDPGESLEEAVARRVLGSAGDLHDAPLRRLDAAFQAPQRYLAVLRILAEGEQSWGALASRMGEGGGNRLAPYLKRLTEEGLIRVRRPLGSSERSRDRRYGLSDPFLGFWFHVVLPRRSALLRLGPEGFWEQECRPRLQEHMDRWMPEAARRWLQEHAPEGLGAPAREVGSIWGAEGPDLDVAGRLTSGVVAYGVVQRGDEEAGLPLLQLLQDRVAATRYGIGREARASLLFIQGPEGEALRRGVARERMARILTMEDLMGTRSG